MYVHVAVLMGSVRVQIEMPIRSYSVPLDLSAIDLIGTLPFPPREERSKLVCVKRSIKK